MGKTLLAALIASTCLTTTLAEAQTSSLPGTPTRMSSPPRSGSSGASSQQPSAQPGRPTPPPPPAPSPSSAAPIVPPAPPSALDRADVFRATPRTYAPRYDRSRQRFSGGYGTGFGYVTDPFGYISQPESSAPALDRYMRSGDAADGYLRLDVQPESAQVYVDGFYAGTVADFTRGGRALDAGPHRIELRADGYDSQSVELRIRANDVLSYRGTLTRRGDRPELRAAAGPPKTFYVIPRCYAGTSRPRAEQLPAGCRVSDVRELPLVVTDARPVR